MRYVIKNENDKYFSGNSMRGPNWGHDFSEAVTYEFMWEAEEELFAWADDDGDGCFVEETA